MSTKTALMLFALTAIQREDHTASTGDTKVIHEIAPNTVFEARDEKEVASLTRLGAVREPTKEEVATEKARQEEEGDDGRSNIIASIPRTPVTQKADTKAVDAGTKPGKERAAGTVQATGNL